MSIESDRPRQRRRASSDAGRARELAMFRSPTGSRSSSLPRECRSMRSSCDVLSPVQTELGRRWAAGDLGIADEHAASAAIEDLLVRLGATAESARWSGGRGRECRARCPCAGWSRRREQRSRSTATA